MSEKPLPTWRDVRAALESAPKPDADFATDLAEIRAAQQTTTTDRWETA
jgi:hypothetical protein